MSDRALLNTTTHIERLVGRNTGFIRQRANERHGPLPDKSGVPLVVSRCGLVNLMIAFIALSCALGAACHEYE